MQQSNMLKILRIFVFIIFSSFCSKKLSFPFDEAPGKLFYKKSALKMGAEKVFASLNHSRLTAMPLTLASMASSVLLSKPVFTSML